MDSLKAMQLQLGDILEIVQIASNKFSRKTWIVQILQTEAPRRFIVKILDCTGKGLADRRGEEAKLYFSSFDSRDMEITKLNTRTAMALYG